MVTEEPSEQSCAGGKEFKSGPFDAPSSEIFSDEVVNEVNWDSNI